MKILVAAGSSGGHVFPALAFLEALKEKDKNIEALLVLPGNKFTRNIRRERFSIRYISVRAIRLKADLGNLIALFDFLKGFLESFFIFLEFRPTVVVGFGGIATMPLVFLAWLFRVKAVTHEQNVIPGEANKFLSKIVDTMAISFAETRGYLSHCPAKIILTGNPLRKSLRVCDKNTALSFFGLKGGMLTILVMGGSLGSRNINSAFLKAISGLVDKSAIQVIHLAGDVDLVKLEARYRDLAIKAKSLGFLQQMQYAYSASDFSISRSGALTISEVIFFKLPAILIPYPFAYQHQLANARVLEKEGSAVIINDDNFTAEALKDKLRDFISNPEKLNRMRLGFAAMPCLDPGALLVNEAIYLN